MRALRVVVSMLASSAFGLGCGAEIADGAVDEDGASVLAQQADGAAAPAEGIDLTGTWFAKVKTKADIRAPIVGVAPSDVDLTLKLVVSKADGKMSADVSVCQLATNSPSLTLDFKRVVPNIKQTESVPDFVATIGGKVPLPNVVFHIGQDEKGTPVDMDKDTFPGGTVGAVALGLVPLDAYIGLDLQIAMDATLIDPQTVGGTATFSGKGNVFGSNFPLLTSGFVTVAQTLTPTPFTAKHYAGDVPCAELMAKP